MATCHFCHFCRRETVNPYFVYADGREDVPTCNPPCRESRRPMPVARATKVCSQCGRDCTNEDTYGGIGWCCIPDDIRELIAGDPALRALRRL